MIKREIFFLLSHWIHYSLIKRKNFFSFQCYIRYALATRKRKWFYCTIIFHHYLSSLCKYLLTSHRANICSWNSWTFPWYIPGIFRKRSLWNSGEYSQNNVTGILNIGIFPECSMNVLRMLHALSFYDYNNVVLFWNFYQLFFRCIKKYNSSFL